MLRLVSLLLGAAFALSACASGGKSASALQPGMTKAEVVKSLGAPENRSFRGSDEALEYRRIAGFGQCEYTTVWLRSGRVVGVTQRRGSSVAGCGLGSEPVDWSQMPE